jgi:2-phospho-L-lactate guanylyltransferase
MIPVVVPVKPRGRALGRLAAILDPAARGALQEAMLKDVLSAALLVTDRVIVVTSDRPTATLSVALGAEVVPDADPPSGINAAVALGIRAAAASAAVMVVMGDTPGVTARELRLLSSAAPATPGITLAVSRDGTGTNAMLVRPPHVIPPSFGAGSLQRHRMAAAAAGVECTVVTAPGLMLDIDTPDDLAAFLAAAPSSHSFRLCESLGCADRTEAGAAR